MGIASPTSRPSPRQCSSTNSEGPDEPTQRWTCCGAPTDLDDGRARCRLFGRGFGSAEQCADRGGHAFSDNGGCRYRRADATAQSRSHAGGLPDGRALRCRARHLRDRRRRVLPRHGDHDAAGGSSQSKSSENWPFTLATTQTRRWHSSRTCASSPAPASRGPTTSRQGRGAHRRSLRGVVHEQPGFHDPRGARGGHNRWTTGPPSPSLSPRRQLRRAECPSNRAARPVHGPGALGRQTPSALVDRRRSVCMWQASSTRMATTCSPSRGTEALRANSTPGWHERCRSWTRSALQGSISPTSPASGRKAVHGRIAAFRWKSRETPIQQARKRRPSSTRVRVSRCCPSRTGDRRRRRARA